MNRRSFCFPVFAFLLSLALALSTTAGREAEEQEAVRILFAGSSSTYMHNMPNQAARWLQHYGAYQTRGAH